MNKTLHQFLLPLAVGLGLVGALFWKVFERGLSSTLWGDDFDGQLLYWIAERGYYSLIERFSFSEFWNANSFYPHQLTFAYSDTLLSAQLFYAPLRLLGFQPLPALTLTLAGFCLLGCLATDFVLRRLGGFSVSERLLLLVCAHGALSFTGFLYHYQLFGFQLAPAFLLSVYLFLKTLEPRNAALACVLYCLMGGFATYAVPMLFVLVSLAGGIIIIARVVLLEQRLPALSKLLKSLVVMGGIAVTFYFVVLRPYFEVRERFEPQAFSETRKYSANIRSLFAEYTTNSYWYGGQARFMYGDWEHAYFPGYLLLGFLFLCLGLLCREGMMLVFSKEWRSKFSVERREQWVLVFFFFLIFVFAWALSLGPSYKADAAIKFPFYYLADIFPGLKSVRAPGRFGLLFALPFGFFVMFVLRSFFRKKAVISALSCLIALLVAIESFPAFRVFPFRIERRAVYEKVAETIPPDTPLLELPVAEGEHLKTLRNVMTQLQGSTIHWCKLVVGYGGKTSEEYTKLIALDHSIRFGSEKPERLFEFARELKIPYLLLHFERYPAHVSNRFRELVRARAGVILWVEDASALIELRG